MKLMSAILLTFIGLNLSFASMDKGHGLESSKKRLPLDLHHKAQIVAVLEVNEKLHAGFFTFKPKLIKAAAIELDNSIKKIKNKDIAKTLAPAKKLLSELKAKGKREPKNIAYHKISLLLARVIEKYDVGKSYNIYSCPMVKKTWIQNSKKKLRTHNPYAPEMPHCGGRDTDY